MDKCTFTLSPDTVYRVHKVMKNYGLDDKDEQTVNTFLAGIIGAYVWERTAPEESTNGNMYEIQQLFTQMNDTVNTTLEDGLKDISASIYNR